MKKITFFKISSLTIVVLMAFSLCSCFSFLKNLFHEEEITLSEECKEAMSKLDTDVKLEIVFLNDKNEVDSDNHSVNGEVGLSYVHITATQLASEFENISVSYHSIDDVSFMTQFKTYGKMLREVDVIIMRTKSPGVVDGTNFIVYNNYDFYLANSNAELYAYNGEAKIVEAATRLSMD